MLSPVLPVRKCHTKQIFVLVRMQLCSHVDTQTVKRFKREYVAFVMLQVRENEISLRKWSDGTAQFRTLEGTLAVTFAT